MWFTAEIKTSSATYDKCGCMKMVYGHFGPKTLRTQDISALVPKCPMDTLAPP